MTRPSRRTTSEAPAVVDINNDEEEQERVLPAAVRERSRAVEEQLGDALKTLLADLRFLLSITLDGASDQWPSKQFAPCPI